MKEKEIILFDGAMGTYLAQQYNIKIKQCEYANIEHPDFVKEVHISYINAGVDAVKTNTFAANTYSLGVTWDVVSNIVEKGCKLAKDATKGTKVTAFASIGPMPCEDRLKMIEEYKRIIQLFFDNGIKHFLFETFNEYDILIELADIVKSISNDSYVIAQCTVAPDGYTYSGISAQAIIDKLSDIKTIDACGFNCTSGPMHLLEIIKGLKIYKKPISIMPNAGYPTVISGRTVFDTTSDYFADKLISIKECGVKILGGCCGTTPSHIKKVRQRLEEYSHKEEKPVDINILKIGKKVSMPPLNKGKKTKTVAVELDPPLNADISRFLENAKKTYQSGADIITIADCPIGRARVDSSILAAKLKREYGIQTLPHLTCRDRNLNATKALLLGLNAEDVTNVLVVTGDPIPTADRSEIKSVFNFNSVKLAAFINNLNGSIFANKPFRIMAALNVNANNFTAELEKAKRKEEAGVTAMLTQPIYTQQALENLMLAKDKLKAEILGGVMPIISYKNACFINNEVSGINIPDEIVQKYYGISPEEAAEIAVDLSVKNAERVLKCADGLYLITPLNKTEIICKILKNINKI